MTTAKLYAPAEYWQLTPAAKAEICNGCGARKGFKVPRTLWGLSILEACNIHDYMYFMGRTEEDRQEADRAFLNNMIRIIEADSKWIILKILRRYRAISYYGSVRDFGGPAFWDDKNLPEEMHTPGLEEALATG